MQDAVSGAAPANRPRRRQKARAASSADSTANQNLPTNVNPQASPYQQNRLIIKNGEMTLLVADTDRALDRATGVAGRFGRLHRQFQDVAARRLQICVDDDGHSIRISSRWRSAACAGWRLKCRTTLPRVRM
jgi:hypothetical protein